MHEFAIGAVGVFISDVLKNKKINELIYLTGIVFILYPIFYFDIKSIVFLGFMH
jgi:hypothetical protein